MPKKTDPNNYSKPDFKPRKLHGLEAQAARKAKIANSPMPPNRDTSMKGGTSI